MSTKRVLCHTCRKFVFTVLSTVRLLDDLKIDESSRFITGELLLKRSCPHCCIALESGKISIRKELSRNILSHHEAHACILSVKVDCVEPIESSGIPGTLKPHLGACVYYDISCTCNPADPIIEGSSVQFTMLEEDLSNPGSLDDERDLSILATQVTNYLYQSGGISNHQLMHLLAEIVFRLNLSEGKALNTEPDCMQSPRP